MFKKIIEKIEKNKVAILGFGKEGISTYRFIRRHLPEKDLTIIDKNETLKDNTIFSCDLHVTFCLGEHYLEHLNDFELIIKSPGVCLKDIRTDLLENKITSQIGFILEDTDFFTIGVTGSKGKSTTTSLLYSILKDQGKDVFLLGNIGNPPFDFIEDMHKESILVIEMAALQLEFVKKSPSVAILLNLFEEHLDFFGNKEKYYKAKLNIFAFQTKEDLGFYDYDNETLRNAVNENHYPATLIPVSYQEKEARGVYCDENFIYWKEETLKKLYDCTLPRTLIGKHYLKDIMMCLGVAYALHLDFKKIEETLQNFKPLEHRMEKVGTFAGVTYYNDAIATIPEATKNAIEALKNVNTLIFGGMDRKIHYEDFISYLNASSIENFICMKDTGYTIGKFLKNKNVYFCETLKEAVEVAKKVTKKDTICLLSPAASSYNQFKNFEEKGKLYKEYVKNG